MGFAGGGDEERVVGGRVGPNAKLAQMPNFVVNLLLFEGERFNCEIDELISCVFLEDVFEISDFRTVILRKMRSVFNSY